MDREAVDYNELVSKSHVLKCRFSKLRFQKNPLIKKKKKTV